MLKIIEWSNHDELGNFNPTKAKCCGKIITLEHFTNTCPICNSDYNSSGQLLASREQWGEETGEHWVDIVNSDGDL